MYEPWGVFFLQVRSEAFKASTAFIAHLDSAPMRNKFVDMIPLMLAVSVFTNMDIMICSLHLHVLTPLNTPCSNRDTSSGPNSTEACTYHPLK